MPVPNDLRVLCSDLPWVDDWIEEFSRSEYFYVANLKEVLTTELVLPTKNRRRKRIRDIHRDASYPVSWQEFYPNHFGKAWCQANDEEVPETGASFDKTIKVLGREVFFRAHNGRPVSFAKAAMIIQTMDSALSSSLSAYSGNVRDHLSIEFANCYLEGFEHVFNKNLKNLTDGKKLEHLFSGTLQTSTKLFEELARGYPVTHSTAVRIRDYCKETFGDDLMIRNYSSRTLDNIDRLQPEISGKPNHRSMRPSVDEVVIFSIDSN